MFFYYNSIDGDIKLILSHKVHFIKKVRYWNIEDKLIIIGFKIKWNISNYGRYETF